jgi:hypothetical protein
VVEPQARTQARLRAEVVGVSKQPRTHLPDAPWIRDGEGYREYQAKRLARFRDDAADAQFRGTVAALDAIYDAMERSEPGNAGVEGLKPAPERTA